MGRFPPLKNPRQYGRPGLDPKAKERNVIFQDTGGAGDSATNFEYGAPAGNGGTTGGGTVAFQFVFDEASGSIVDEVSSVTLAANLTPTYNEGVPSPFQNLSPGISTNANAEGFRKTTATTEADLGTNDFVIEFVCAFDGGGTGVHYVFSTQDASFLDGYYVYHQPGSNIVCVEIDDGGTQVLAQFTTGDLTDGVFRKYRIRGSRVVAPPPTADGLMELFINGVSQGTVDISSMSANNIEASQLFTHLASHSVNSLLGTLAELRVTTGTTTANSGGPGGG